MSPRSRHGGACTISAGEEAALLQVVVVDEIMCSVYQTPQVGEFSETLICRISLMQNIWACFLGVFVNYLSCPDWSEMKPAIFFHQLPTIASHLFCASLRIRCVICIKGCFPKQINCQKFQTAFMPSKSGRPQIMNSYHFRIVVKFSCHNLLLLFRNFLG